MRVQCSDCGKWYDDARRWTICPHYYLDESPRKEPEMSDTMIQLPRYKCHKEVHALQIKRVVCNEDGSVDIIPQDERYARFTVSADQARNHNWSGGGYYVVYDDGYVSWSPQQAFEEGYAKII